MAGKHVIYIAYTFMFMHNKNFRDLHISLIFSTFVCKCINIFYDGYERAR